MDEPKLDIWKQKNSKNLVLDPLIWHTTTIGSSIEMRLYDYNYNDIQKIFDIDTETVNYELTHKHDNLYEFNFIELNYSATVEIDEQFIKYIDGEHIKLKNFVEFSRHIYYGFFDYDNDGIDELITKRRIGCGAVDWFSYNICTFYEYNDKFDVKKYDIHFDYKKVWPYY
jgi:hypothetical protein